MFGSWSQKLIQNLWLLSHIYPFNIPRIYKIWDSKQTPTSYLRTSNINKSYISTSFWIKRMWVINIRKFKLHLCNLLQWVEESLIIIFNMYIDTRTPLQLHFLSPASLAKQTMCIQCKTSINQKISSFPLYVTGPH